MRVLVTGATGFIGRQVCARLLACGHGVVGTSRRPPAAAADGLQWQALDLAQALHPGDWAAALAHVDAVVNAAGLFAETAAASFDAVHRGAPTALFHACVALGIARVVQVSALAGPGAAPTAFIASKQAADAALQALPLDGVVLRPSLVYGEDGASSRWLLQLASLPLLVVPALAPTGGRGQPPGLGGEVQPVHIDDLVQIIVALVEAPSLQTLPVAPPWPERCLPIVGPQPLPLADYLRELRQGLGLAPAPVLRLPHGLVSLAAAAGDRLRHGRMRPWLTAESLRLLRAGSRADAGPTTALLGHPPRAPAQFVPPHRREDLRRAATLGWTLPMLRLAIAAVWLLTAWVSAFVYPIEESRALLAAVGVPGPLQPWLLVGATGLDALLGVWTLARPGRRLWRLQIVLILLYSGLIAWRLPAFWRHPFGPLTKNLPMLAALVLLDALTPPEGRRWTT